MAYYHQEVYKNEHSFLLVHELIPFFDSTRGTKYNGFLVTSGCLCSRKAWCVVGVGSFRPKLRYFTYQNGPKGDHIKINFDYFQMKKWMLQTVRAKKVDEKIWVICLVSMFLFWVMVCKLSRKVHFLKFWADLGKKSTSVEAMYIYASEYSHYTLSENAMSYRGYEILAIKISKKMLTQQKFLKNSSTSNTNIFETVSHSIINNTNFWKCITRTFRCKVSQKMRNF